VTDETVIDDDPWADLRTKPKVDVQAERYRRMKGQHSHALEAKKRKAQCVDLISQGKSLAEALQIIGVSHSAYKQWRLRDKQFAAEMDVARAGRNVLLGEFNGGHAEFAERYFGFKYAWFQLLFIQELENLPPGNILMALWPPEHGKTTTYENYASETLARHPDRRLTVAGGNLRIATKILERVKRRMEPDGPYPNYVGDWGPFKPSSGMGRDKAIAQPWGSGYFNVFKKSQHDERDYSMQALGFKSEIVSTRTDHLHIDDLQSTKTYNLTDQMEEWLRQDALSRPGEYGITTIAGTRVGEDDIYSRMANDEDLSDILKVIKFRAIRTDPVTGEQHALWPERYNLDQLDRQRRKVGQEAWDRNYMQEPGVSATNRVFTDEMIDRCKDPNISLSHHVGRERVVYVGLDPALGGINCVIACEVSDDGRLIIRRIREDAQLQRNEQIMQCVNDVVAWCNMTGRVTDVVVESMNFQRGLARDERLLDMQAHYGFALREHLTGWNKYDENIGVASMCESFLREEIVIPWAADDYTRTEMEELCRQLRAWKPGKRGSKLRQDRVMALWFVWILWRQRWKRADHLTGGADMWRTRGVPWRGTSASLIIPVGARL
jgi:hypothetical protein